ncbi:unnamed protein product [Protopolystoma xenopodis]|uniref:Talin R4 domain-containing protein n=1 Tax=Protopolystoma xenopodis TaxID=117903 RepID=A0A448XMM3_9PLAT|nr:unnamed protein product [Protopolystoma xenopodis]
MSSIARLSCRLSLSAIYILPLPIDCEHRVPRIYRGQPCEALVRSSRSLSPTVHDAGLQAALTNSYGQMSQAVEALRACLARAEPAVRQLQVAGALARLVRLRDEADRLETAVCGASMGSGTIPLLAALPDDKASGKLALSALMRRDFYHSIFIFTLIPFAMIRGSTRFSLLSYFAVRRKIL